MKIIKIFFSLFQIPKSYTKVLIGILKYSRKIILIKKYLTIL